MGNLQCPDVHYFPQTKLILELPENAQNCRKFPCNKQWIDLGICDGITKAGWLMEKIDPWFSHDGWVSIYVTENNINDDDFF